MEVKIFSSLWKWKEIVDKSPNFKRKKILSMPPACVHCDVKPMTELSLVTTTRLVTTIILLLMQRSCSPSLNNFSNKFSQMKVYAKSYPGLIWIEIRCTLFFNNRFKNNKSSTSRWFACSRLVLLEANENNLFNTARAHYNSVWY